MQWSGGCRSQFVDDCKMDGFWTRIGKKEIKTLPFKNFALAEEKKSGKIPRETEG